MTVPTVAALDGVAATPNAETATAAARTAHRHEPNNRI